MILKSQMTKLSLRHPDRVGVPAMVSLFESALSLRRYNLSFF